MADLTVCSVSAFSTKYLLFQDYVMRLLADDSKFHRLVCNVVADPEGMAQLARLPETTVFDFNVNGLRGSDAHGAALNECVKRIQTEWLLITDPDICVLSRGWDTLCKRAVHHRRAAVGASNDPAWGQAKPQDFPGVYFFFARTRFIQEMKVDWRPLPERWRNWRSWMLKRAPGFAIDWFIGNGDTGCRVRDQFRRRRYTAAVFDYHHHTEPGNNVMAPDIRADEYHWQGIPIVTHIGKSGNRPFNQEPVSQSWVNRLTGYLSLDPQVIAEITSRNITQVNE
jgi:hypothetical protein